MKNVRIGIIDHTVLGIAALQAGKHVLVEKPISVHKADAEKLIAASNYRTPKVTVAGADMAKSFGK